jgi:phospholipase D-like protein
VVASSYPFLDVMWTMLVFFGWVIWFWLLITAFGDVFRRRDLSGLGKTGWIILMIVLPYLGVFIYLITQHDGMAERNVQQMQQSKAEMDDYVRSVSASSDPAEQIAKGKALLDQGAISQAEFDTLKQKALAQGS